MIDGPYSNKVAIITGASSGVGYETARLFASLGCRVAPAARSEKHLIDL